MNKLPYRQVHLDFHTPKLPFKLGEKFDKKVFQKTLQEANVESITLTGRCHHGHIYYETTLPARHPQMQGDFLMKQVDACHEVGIKAPIYLTVGWDAFSADRHPEWLERKPDNSIYGFQNYGQLEPGWKTLCFNTPYLEYLKLQIRDVMQHFDSKLDGLFFDIVWQDPCCCNFCISKMLNCGLNPESEKDRLVFAKQTENFLKDEIYRTVYEVNKECPIFFNEGNILPSIRSNLSEYSHLEIESLPSGEWGYQHFPTVVRYAKNLGKEYVGMTGKFHKVWADFGSYKNLAALEYETFLALAHGAKCSIGDQMYPDGSLQPATYNLIGKVYGQVAELEEYNDNSVAVTEIAIVHPGVVSECEGKVDLSLAGAVNILNEAQYQFDVVDVQMDWSHYKVIILPDKIKVSDELKNKVSEYLHRYSGKILATFKSGLDEKNEFLPEWGIEYIMKNPYEPTYGCYESMFYDSLPKGELVLHGPGLLVEPSKSEVLGCERQPMYQRNYQHYFSHFQAPVSQLTGYPVITKNDQVVYFTHPLFEMYKTHGVLQYKQLILVILEKLLHGALVKTTLPSTGDVILNHNLEKKELILNMLHYVPQRKSVELDTIEEVIPIYNVKVELALDRVSGTSNQHFEIDSVVDVRNHQKIDYVLKDDKLVFTIPVVEGFQITVIKYK